MRINYSTYTGNLIFWHRQVSVDNAGSITWEGNGMSYINYDMSMTKVRNLKSCHNMSSYLKLELIKNKFIFIYYFLLSIQK